MNKKDENKLLDFDYTNEDVESLRQQMRLPAHVSSPLSEGEGSGAGANSTLTLTLIPLR